MIKLSNDQLSVTINEKGAELQSIQLNGLEYLWQADPKYWAKHSPVLFPIVGELKDGIYVFDNKQYRLPRHGFARDKIFKSQKTSSTCVIFTLHSEEETFSVFPFHFIFQVEYEIINNELSCTYIVKNIDDDDIYFSVGGHPAFRVPLSENLKYTDYLLKFENDNELTRYMLHEGLTGNDIEKIKLDEKKLQLRPSLFYNDAIVLKNISSKQIKLYTPKDDHGLTFEFENFPYFGIWAAKDAPFICLEPWCGIADNIYHDHQLQNKEGINKLTPGDLWRRKWSVKLF